MKAKPEDPIWSMSGLCLLRELVKEHQMATRNSSAPAPTLLPRCGVLCHSADLFAEGEIPAILLFKEKKQPKQNLKHFPHIG